VFAVAARGEAGQTTSAVAHIEREEKRLRAALDLPPVDAYGT
jgi:hypothetical protein